MHGPPLTRKMVLLMSVVFAGCFAGGAVPAYSDSPAVAEKPRTAFSLVGLIDLDHDGISDRKLLHKHINSAGGSIDNEVDDEGVRKPAGGKMTSRTKYLVVGTIIYPANVADPKQRQVAKRMVQHYEDMRAEARKAGVRIVRLADFTTFGRSRPWSARRYQLREGEKRSTGKTSSIYSRGQRVRQPTNK